jgi:polar amino acid transport system substrate-binding protein
VFRLALTLALAISPVLVERLNAQQAPDPRVADLIRANTVRVGMGLAPTIATKDAATGELKGVGMDLARATRRTPRGYRPAGRIFEPPQDPRGPRHRSLGRGVFNTYLVPAGSSVRIVGDADQPGIRIAVTRQSVGDVALTRLLKRAEVQRVDTAAAGLEGLRAGHVHVLASDRPNLLQLSTQLSGSRVLDDRYHSFFLAMVVPKGQAGRHAYISEFIEEAKASGLVKQLVERAGLQGVQVAPAGSTGMP